MAGAATESTLLTELCALCHINPLKYTCPRCGIHTCSLACVKRHKLWAQCSGVRDPAAFRKRIELATPSSIDQDFNFITKVERSLHRAEDDAVERGIDLHAAGVYSRNTGERTKLETKVEELGITIVKAPKGLSRNKQNRSHWDFRHKCIMWTIEWVLPDDRKVLANVQDTKTIIESYKITVGKKGLPRKRQRDEFETTSPKSEEDVVTSVDLPPSAMASADNPITATVSGLYFYLHKPNTTSRLKCLIPVGQVNMLNEILRNRTLLEFPTIFVRAERAEQLPQPYVLEETYLTRYGNDIPVNLAILDHENPTQDDMKALPDKIDNSKLLEVLKKDLGS